MIFKKLSSAYIWFGLENISELIFNKFVCKKQQTPEISLEKVALPKVRIFMRRNLHIHCTQTVLLCFEMFCQSKTKYEIIYELYMCKSREFILRSLDIQKIDIRTCANVFQECFHVWMFTICLKTCEGYFQSFETCELV